MSIAEYNRISTIRSFDYTQVPSEFKTKPTNSDRDQGWYYRYFMSKSNGIDGTREVSRKTFDEFSSNAFWIGVSIKWNISDTVAYELNRKQIRIGLRTMLGVDDILPNLTEFHMSGEYVSTGALEPSKDVISEQGLFD